MIMKNILIKKGKIVSSEKEFQGDILISDSKIAKIKNSILDFPDGTEIINASKMIVLPGGIDAHVHLDLPTPAGPSSDDFYSGSIAAIYGGTTSFIDFVTPSKNESLLAALKARLKFSEKSLLDYSFHMSITSWKHETAREMEEIVQEHGITSFKTYLAYKGGIGIEESELFEVMKTAAKLNALVTVHCEMGSEILRLQKKFISEGKTSPKYHALSRPAECEAQSVKNVIALAKKSKCPVYIVHTSAAASVEEIEKAQKSGQPVYSETCPQYLLLDDSVYDLPLPKSLKYVISPPIRKKEDQEKLWEGLKNGSIQVIATDHCPFNSSGQKDKGKNDFTKIPNGAGGIEHRLPLLYTEGVLKNKISLQQFVKLCSSNPAKIFRLLGKGDISADADADIVLWNPDTEKSISVKTHHQHCDSNIFESFITSGAPEIVFVKGKKILHGHTLITSGMKGSFLKRS
jgi:dihydropyrimidinase